MSKITSVLVQFFVFTGILIVGCEKEKRMRPEEIRAMVRCEIEEFWNKENSTAGDEIIATNYVLHEAVKDINGLEAFKRFSAGFRAAFPDAHFDIDDVIVEGNKVVLRYTFRGKHGGDYGGIASTGKEVIATGIRFSRVAGGKLQETWNYIDKLSVLVQLGWWVPSESWLLAFTWGEPVEPVVVATSDPEENKSDARRGLEELWNTGDLAIADEVYAIKFVNHEVTHSQFRGLESYKKYVTAIRSVMSDFRVTIEDMIAEGDEVAVRWKVSGTEKITGNAYAWGGIVIFRLSDHKIVEAWWSRDALGIAQQMGIVPTLVEVK